MTTPDAFRRDGYTAVDFVADYLTAVANPTYPVLSRVEPGWVRSQLPAAAPEDGEPFDQVVADLHRVILPGVTHWQSPNFFAYFPANNSGPSIIGELVAAGLGVQGMMWQTSPACTELETLMLDWLVDLLGLPLMFRSDAAGGGVIQDSASSAALCAVVAARERATEGKANVDGCRAPLMAYATRQAHMSIEKAVRVAGLGSANIRWIPTRSDGSMSPEALQAAIAEDRAAGRVPCFAAATIGTTATNAMDPLPAIGEICRAAGVWLHVDAAMSGSAAICPEYRYLLAGLDLADSFCVNPHKWLLTNFDCDAFWVRDKASLINALSLHPDYLHNAASDSGAVIDYRDWQIPLGRRFRALKLWFVLRTYGAEALRAMVRRHVAAAQWFAAMVDKSELFELAAPAPLNLVCFRHVGGEAASRHVLDVVNQGGSAFMTHAMVNDQFTLRLSVGQERTTQAHVAAVWDTLVEAAATVAQSAAEPPPDEAKSTLPEVNLRRRWYWPFKRVPRS
jgi:aromatic-L-amino-acid decarboxylase